MGVVHVERLSERGRTSVGRPIKQRTTIEIGVDERHSVGGYGLLLRLGSKRAKGSLEAKKGQEGNIDHERQGNGKSG